MKAIAGMIRPILNVSITIDVIISKDKIIIDFLLLWLLIFLNY